jgi:hypothetical protein
MSYIYLRRWIQVRVPWLIRWGSQRKDFWVNHDIQILDISSFPQKLSGQIAKRYKICGLKNLSISILISSKTFKITLINHYEDCPWYVMFSVKDNCTWVTLKSHVIYAIRWHNNQTCIVIVEWIEHAKVQNLILWELSLNGFEALTLDNHWNSMRLFSSLEKQTSMDLSHVKTFTSTLIDFPSW